MSISDYNPAADFSLTPRDEIALRAPIPQFIFQPAMIMQLCGLGRSELDRAAQARNELEAFDASFPKSDKGNPLRLQLLEKVMAAHAAYDQAANKIRTLDHAPLALARWQIMYADAFIQARQEVQNRI